MQQDTKLIRLSVDYQIKPFDCGDSDLNEFLQNDSKKIFTRITCSYLFD